MKEVKKNHNQYYRRMPTMPVELWFQYDSTKKDEFRNCNKPLCEFLEKHMPALLVKLKQPINFKLVDVSIPSDIKEAAERGVRNLPMLINNDDKKVGLSEIQKYIVTIIKGGSQEPRQRQRSDTHDDGLGSPVRPTDDEQDIQNLWWDGIVENDDDECEGNEDVNDRLARAEAFTKRREKMTEKPSHGRRRPQQGRKRPDTDDGQDHRPRARPDGYRPSGQSRPKQPPRAKSRVTPEPEEEEEETPRKKTPAKVERRRRGADLEVSPAEISKSLNPGDGQAHADDELMSRFWENQTSTSY